MDGNALEVALGLVRLPAMRGSLRQRPLPDGVGEVIELAGGARRRLAEASVLSGETPQQVLEAARFYVREVLLFPDADAYRVLGVAETASAAQIKLHYRRLQHWLHPDRRGDDWESAFATRINTAWGELRSPGRRAAYDAQRAQLAQAEGDATPHRVLVNEWRAVPDGNAPRREWLLPATAMAGCLCLAVLVALKGEAPAPEWDSEPNVATDAEPPSLSAAATAAVERMRARLDAPAEEQAPVPPTSLSSSSTEMVIAESPLEKESGEAFDAPVLAAPAKQATPSLRASASKERTARQAKAAAASIPEPSGPTRAPSAAPARQMAELAPAPLLEHVQLAHRRGTEVTRYLGLTTSQAPPIWDSLVALDSATVIRERLDGGRSRLFRKVRFGEPDWRIAEGRASMSATIERSGRGDENGTLRVELVWREGTWLVEQVAAVGL